MAVKERHIGALYIDGKKVGIECEDFTGNIEMNIE